MQKGGKMNYEIAKTDIGKPVFETFENENLKATHFLFTGETEIEFKPNCPKKIKDMWDMLNEPYKKILHKSR